MRACENQRERAKSDWESVRERSCAKEHASEKTRIFARELERERGEAGFAQTQKNRPTDRETEKKTGRQIDKKASRQAGGQIDRQTGGQTDTQTERQAGRQAGRQTGRQTGRHTGTRTHRQIDT